MANNGIPLLIFFLVSENEAKKEAKYITSLFEH